MNIILAQVLGIVFTVVGLSLIVNKKGVPMMIIETSDSQGLWWLYGFIALVFGAVLMAFNNAWNSGLQSVITIFAWLALIKGIYIVVFPKSSTVFYKKVCKSNLVVLVGVIIFVLGLTLLFYGGVI